MGDTVPMPLPSSPALRAAAAVGLLGAACIAYGTGYEVRSYRLRRVEVPGALPTGADPLRVLHLSDLHLVPGQRAKRDWVRALAALEPDLVVDTGDNLAHPEAVPYLLDALGPLLERPGLFVLGSNDYFGPRLKNPARYLIPGDRRRLHGPDLPWKDLVAGLEAEGWADLGNRRAALEVGGLRIEARGVDDPHIHRDAYAEVAGPAEPVDGRAPDLVLGVTHAPYHRVTDAMAADGCSLILAGHTHGGQLCVPWLGALVTNCDLAPGRAKGLSPHAFGADGSVSAWLHVSAGLGTSPYAPIRFACPPEATLLTLLPR